uniref:STE20like serine/threonineprotein kinaselike [Bombyx mori] n=1 Tax=Lepeophtheirus salmonis TaxID=72036 RepID=A0A0K2TYZ4_LEPSM
MPFLSHLKKVLHFGGGSDGGGKGFKGRITPNIKTGLDPEQEWEIVGDLGDGAFGKVHKACHRETGKLAAAKVCRLTHEEDLEDFAVEIDILSEMFHPNVITLFEAYFFADQLWVNQSLLLLLNTLCLTKYHFSHSNCVRKLQFH